VIPNRRYWNKTSLRVAGRERTNCSNIYSDPKSLPQLRLRHERL